MIQDWSVITIDALKGAWLGFLSFVPKLIGASIIFVVGWIFAMGVGRLIAEFLKRVKVNQAFERTGWKQAFEKADLKVNPSEFIGAIIKWILVIVFLLASVEILGFDQFAVILVKLINWLPNVIVSVAIFVAAIIITDILEKLVKVSVRKMEIGYADFLGALVRWSIYTFAALAILTQLNAPIVDTIVKGFVWMIAAAVGISFGLGGKDAAARLIEDLRQKLSSK
jgi:hypothetical protein